MKYTQKY